MTNNKIRKTDSQWRAQLSDAQYAVTREAATEPPNSGAYVHHDETGVYCCVCCGSELFTSEHKFNAGCGWPSFTLALAGDRVSTREDSSHGMHRTEVRCSQCDAHLGHVFPDGPGPGGLRYCINSLALQFNKG